ncbi:ABC transporter permease [Rhodospirillaceae bacterium KN72]|uniref:ABC transporter permease n=1 Tax=Pacificispira spongiicola TaxID=2729598 RepID=A0A7Y0E0P3_9PROT|nr:ABC transporter permease [Pacificispira spongiicola]NMM45087.1 ABC transporter permease [Pacificispira spongiicola]
MAGFLIRRLTGLVLTLLAASAVVFLALELLPGDAAQILLGTEVRPDTLAAMRAQLGLDRPAALRYAEWIAGLATGDLGVSQVYHVPVWDMVRDRLAVSLPLAVLAFILSTLLALPFGITAAVKRGRLADTLIMGFAQIGLAVPNFWFGILLILLFAVQLGWVSAGGFPGWEGGVGPALGALFLPALALALSEAAILSRMVRASMLETLGEDYVRTARAKGLSGSRIVVGHALGNAMIPIATLMGLQFAFLVAGAVIIENVFYLPGVGRLLLQAIFERDLVLVRNLVLMLSAFVVALSFLVDMAYGAIDPRLRRAT